MSKRAKIQPPKIRYLSLFSGIGGAEVALKNVFGEENLECVGFCELDEKSKAVYLAHNPKHKCLGDVVELWKQKPKLGKLDLIVGGPPCQEFSYVNNQKKELGSERGNMTLLFIDLVHHYKPTCFIMENVYMRFELRDRITEQFKMKNVRCTFLDAKFFTAQNRRRNYWTNFKIPTKHLEVSPMTLGDIIQPCSDNTHKFAAKNRMVKKTDIFKLAKETKDVEPPFALFPSQRGTKTGSTNFSKQRMMVRSDGKSNCLVGRTDGTQYLYDGEIVRTCTPIEAERLQGFPDNYTKLLSDHQRKQRLGNAFNVPTFEYLFDCSPLSK